MTVIKEVLASKNVDVTHFELLGQSFLLSNALLSWGNSSSIAMNSILLLIKLSKISLVNNINGITKM